MANSDRYLNDPSLKAPDVEELRSLRKQYQLPRKQKQYSLMGRFINFFTGKDNWLGPATPLEPKEPLGEPPRRQQYQPGYNIAIQPRSTEPITFAQMRNLADSCDLVRIVIERVKNAILADDWDIIPRDSDSTVPQTRINKVKKFFEKPDKRHTWDEWMGMALE